MLRIIRSIAAIDLRQLFDIYEECFIENLRDGYGSVSAFDILNEQQDFYHFLQDFFKEPDNIYAVWVDEGRYCSALRIEQYRDGYLLTGLETAPDKRRNGYASMLMNSVIEFCKSNALLPIYSHIANSNIPSIKTHTKNGFNITSDYAVYLDGSVDHRSKTYCYTGIKKTKS